MKVGEWGGLLDSRLSDWSLKNESHPGKGPSRRRLASAGTLPEAGGSQDWRPVWLGAGTAMGRQAMGPEGLRGTGRGGRLCSGESRGILSIEETYPDCLYVSVYLSIPLIYT